jgi:hypothetical protein
MKSSIKIDFIDRGTGKGIEPVIRVEIIKSEDPRDTLISTLFQSMQGKSYMEFAYSNHKHISTESGLPDMEKTALLFKPEIDIEDFPGYAIQDNSIAFTQWLTANEVKWDSNGHQTIIKENIDFFKLGVEWEKYRELNEPRRQS